MEPTIGMVIPIYTTRFINRLVGYMRGTVHRDDVTICVVNDGQREVSEFLSRQKYPDSVVVLNLPSQQGFSALNNFGWKNLTERFPTIQYLGTLNDDTIPRDGWLDELAVCLKKYPRTALSSPIMQVKRGPLRLNRSFATWRLKGSDEMEPVASKILSDTFVPVVSGFCFLARRDALEQVGYLDEQFRNGCEDVDLCLKLTSCGWRLVICSRSFVYHEEAKSRYLPGTGTNLRRNHAILANKWNHDVARFNKVQPKTIAFCIAYNQEHFIEAWVRNAAQYADELLVMFAPVAWTYNTAARRTIQPDKTLEILEELSKEFPKLTVVTGDWKDETQNRNDAVNIARKLGAGWLLIVDTDEFYYQYKFSMLTIGW